MDLAVIGKANVEKLAEIAIEMAHPNMSLNGHRAAVERINNILFPYKNKAALEDCRKRFAAGEFDNMEKVEVIRAIRVDYAFSIGQAMTVCNDLLKGS